MEDRSFYVYAHYRLDTMEPFYIGKGKGNRKDIISRNHMHDRISKKHGHAVVILYDNLTEEESFFYEREVIEDLVFNEGYEISCKNCGEFTGKFSYLTNFSFGGEGVSGYNFSEETKKKMSKSQIESQKKRYENEEEREKLSKVQIKRFQDEKEREKMSKAQIKRYKDEKEREKISIGNKKRFKDPKEREKVGRHGEKSCHVKSVYCRELNIIFSYIGLAEKYCINVLNIKIGPISRVCNGKREFTGKLADGTKLTWKWLEDVDEETLNNAEYIDSEKYEEIIKAKLNEK